MFRASGMPLLCIAVLGKGITLLCTPRVLPAGRFGTQQRIPGQRSIADSVWQGRNNSNYYVESKFCTSGLTKPQRAAQSALGGAYQVDRWGYPWFGNVGSSLGGTAGAVAGGVQLTLLTKRGRIRKGDGFIF